MHPAMHQAHTVSAPMKPSISFVDTRVLAVIDSAVVLLDIEDTLKDIGVGMIKAMSSAMQAVALLPAQEFDVAVLGIGECAGHSQKLLAELDRLHVPVILVESGAALSGALHDMTGKHVVTAPFNTAAFTQALNRALARG